MKDIQDLRVDYTQKENFLMEGLPTNPLALFKDWFELAKTQVSKDPNAMSLSTVDRNGFPRNRYVLLKGLNEHGLIFYTNYTSQKAKDIDHTDKVSLTFLWKEMERQVRIVGVASKIPQAQSQEYFHSRPRGSQLAAYVSAQSSPLASREELKAAYEEGQRQFEAMEIPYPQFWGGYLVEPIEVEFWLGRESRLHDRVLYKKNFSNWDKTLLQP